MKRKASAEWRGGLKEGDGDISTESGALRNLPYSFGTRFENEVGTNPEELVGAAHAGCFSMALAAALEKSGHAPTSIRTTASIVLEKLGEGFTVTESHLSVQAEVPGATAELFEKAANEAKTGCPMSRLLKAKITMDAKLV